MQSKMEDKVKRRIVVNIYEKLEHCYAQVKEKISFQPEIALVLGSGLNSLAENMNVVSILPYHEIEGFPISTVAGHQGRFLFGYFDEVPVVVMQGRVHYYEGYSMSDVVLPIRLMGLLGAKILFLTNAAGGVCDEFVAGDLMMLVDHIAAFVPNPLIGPNLEALGVRFPDMSEIYDETLQEILRQTAKRLGISLKEGVYMQFTGPSYESKAEIRMSQRLGADAVGMSTACEAIAANHMGMKICAISCITNMAAGIQKTPLSHEEVQEASQSVRPKFERLIWESIQQMYLRNQK